MQALSNLLSLLNITCGIEFLILFLVVEAMLFAGALYLLFVVRQQQAFVIYLPLTLLPLFIGGLRSLVTLSTAVELLRNADASSVDQPDGVVLLAMSAAPVLFGIVVTMPAFIAVVSGRALMVLQANRKPRASKQQVESSQLESSRNGEHVVSATESYLAELVRNRR